MRVVFTFIFLWGIQPGIAQQSSGEFDAFAKTATKKTRLLFDQTLDLQSYLISESGKYYARILPNGNFVIKETETDFTIRELGVDPRPNETSKQKGYFLLHHSGPKLVLFRGNTYDARQIVREFGVPGKGGHAYRLSDIGRLEFVDGSGKTIWVDPASNKTEKLYTRMIPFLEKSKSGEAGTSPQRVDLMSIFSMPRLWSGIVSTGTDETASEEPTKPSKVEIDVFLSEYLKVAERKLVGLESRWLSNPTEVTLETWWAAPIRRELEESHPKVAKHFPDAILPLFDTRNLFFNNSEALAARLEALSVRIGNDTDRIAELLKAEQSEFQTVTFRTGGGSVSTLDIVSLGATFAGDLGIPTPGLSTVLGIASLVSQAQDSGEEFSAKIKNAGFQNRVVAKSASEMKFAYFESIKVMALSIRATKQAALQSSVEIDGLLEAREKNELQNLRATEVDLDRMAKSYRKITWTKLFHLGTMAVRHVQPNSKFLKADETYLRKFSLIPTKPGDVALYVGVAPDSDNTKGKLSPENEKDLLELLEFIPNRQIYERLNFHGQVYNILENRADKELSNPTLSGSNDPVLCRTNLGERRSKELFEAKLVEVTYRVFYEDHDRNADKWEKDLGKFEAVAKMVMHGGVDENKPPQNVTIARHKEIVDVFKGKNFAAILPKTPGRFGSEYNRVELETRENFSSNRLSEKAFISAPIFIRTPRMSELARGLTTWPELEINMTLSASTTSFKGVGEFGGQQKHGDKVLQASCKINWASFDNETTVVMHGFGQTGLKNQPEVFVLVKIRRIE